ncbi:MAG: orotidine 5'-phosphate decarboxylase / HUMPS family protein [Nanoarchaeota archaeon]|nr:orotidine 5'-phosphate decarboxylase / HUMPS family protein [Nanoarchaeota archaeon]
MEEYKRRFVDFLLKTGALKVFEDSKDDRTLKSKRISPWFINIGDFNDGESSNALAEFYADAIIGSGVNPDSLYGIPDKGVGLAAPVAMAMAAKGHNVGWFFSRKDEKTHGEATNLGQEDRIKKLTVGRAPKPTDAIAQLDDVFTAGDAKYEANTFLESLGRTNLPLLAIAVDRQEVAIDSREAILEYTEKTGTRVVSVVNAVDVYKILANGNLVPEKALERLRNYLRVYGTKEARTAIGRGVEQKIIGRERSVIPACDVATLEQFEELVKQTADVEGIGAYKIGFGLGLRYGLPKVVEIARKHTNKPLIYDHQKAATDIPETGRDFAELNKEAGIDAVILFPQAGPETERAWIYHALDKGLKVIVGGRMTHPAHVVSEGGFITDEGTLDMYRIGARAGLTNFVVPGNKPEVIKQVRELIEAEGVSNPVFHSPGFVAQGGKISDAAKYAGDRFHGIIGRGITQAKDPHAAAVEYTSQFV